MITRSISFKPFCSKDYHKLDSQLVEDSRFEEKLCESIITEIPAIKYKSGTTSAEKVQNYLQESGEKEREEVSDKVYLFIKSEEITHYVSAIDLGAAIYSISNTQTTTSSKGAGATVSSEQIAGVGVKTKKSTEKTNKKSSDQRIGDLDKVTRGVGEAVVGYKLLPLFVLVRKGEVKKILQKAIRLYLDRTSESQSV